MSSLRTRAIAFTVLVLLSANAAVAASGAIPAGPTGNAFYTPPSPLPVAANGDVIWQRPLSGGDALPSAAQNILVLYRTTSVNGNPVAVSGAVSIPRGTAPAGGWPVISWAHGTTGNAPQCAPTRESEPNEEQLLLDHWVARGYVVTQTDYEGEGTPGIHPYFVGVAAGRDVTDIVRAARAVDASVGNRWVAMGHSEGGHAALFAAAVGPQWAPELDLLGTVSLAPGSHGSFIVNARLASDKPAPFFPFFMMMIQGVASTDPQIDLASILSPAGLAKLPELQTRCEDELLNDPAWTAVPTERFFVKVPDIGRLHDDLYQNEPSLLRLTVPVLLLQGEADPVVAPLATQYVASDLCKRGANVEYDTFAGEDHGSILGRSLGLAERWVDARFAGTPAKSTCP